MKSTVIFAIFGFFAALVQSFGQEQGFGETMRSGLGWAAVFGILGWGIGRAARAISRPNPRLAPVISQILLIASSLLLTEPVIDRPATPGRAASRHRSHSRTR